MLRNVKASVLPLCSIVTGIGLLAAGCTNTEAPVPDGEVNLGCDSVENTFAIDHSELQAVDGVAPGPYTAPQFRAEQFTERAQTLRVKECKDTVHVTFDDRGTGYRSGQLQVVDAYRSGDGIEGVIVVTLDNAESTALELTFHATAVR